MHSEASEVNWADPNATMRDQSKNLSEELQRAGVSPEPEEIATLAIAMSGRPVIIHPGNVSDLRKRFAEATKSKSTDSIE